MFRVMMAGVAALTAGVLVIEEYPSARWISQLEQMAVTGGAPPCGVCKTEDFGPTSACNRQDQSCADAGVSCSSGNLGYTCGAFVDYRAPARPHTDLASGVEAYASSVPVPCYVMEYCECKSGWFSYYCEEDGESEFTSFVGQCAVKANPLCPVGGGGPPIGPPQGP